MDEEYFNWLVGIIGNYECKNYSYLLSALFDTQFIFFKEHDVNRAKDGLDLRLDFLNTHPYYNINRECSVLEMMIALANRIETSITQNDIYGNRTAYWFWGMIDSLGLSNMTDRYFDKDYFDNVINKFLRRQYSPNGRGGLFTLRYTDKDMRDAEIWYQAMWYLVEQGQ